jgi:hypothetical protein
MLRPNGERSVVRDMTDLELKLASDQLMQKIQAMQHLQQQMQATLQMHAVLIYEIDRRSRVISRT